MRIPALSALLLLAAVLPACAAPQAGPWTPVSRWSRLRTYAWLGISAEPPDAESVAERVRSAVDDELAAKGFTLVDYAPDFLVTVKSGSVDQPVRRVWVGQRETEYARNGQWWEQRLGTIEQGTLVVHLIDAPSGRPLWTGTLRGQSHGDLPPEQRTRHLRDDLRLILAEFPPTDGR